MIQHILDGHPDIGTTEEPWLLLPLLFPHDPASSTEKYGAHIADVGVRSFFERVSADSDQGMHARCVRAFAREAYGAANAVLGTELFLDKTPRYYLIINEILQTFPAAKILILVRNPCAVFTSILTSWVRDILLKLKYFKIDFMEGPQAIVDACEKNDSRILVVKYEEFLERPQEEIRRILSHLDLPSHPGLEEYGGRDLSWFGLGDHKSVYHLEKPDPDRAAHWVKDLHDPQIWRLTRDYVRWLEGRGLLSSLGYDLEFCKEQIKAAKPSIWARSTTIPLSWLLGEGSERTQAVRELIIRLRCKLTGLSKCRRQEESG